jgi:hypothetical protein
MSWAAQGGRVSYMWRNTMHGICGSIGWYLSDMCHAIPPEINAEYSCWLRARGHAPERAGIGEIRRRGAGR